MTEDDPRVCPYPGHDSVVCPACHESIPGVVPGGTADDPEPRCPACDAAIDRVIVGR
ncbi:hypothetical protein [Haloarcula litorea]|uniref:hypothetical protein n=1 Tax=Haloarcula litorea TaxID=3032579 RepID=UPI0023E8F5FB|nr:hypothetical protein [Halomicroarcula sp. GDY20]